MIVFRLEQFKKFHALLMRTAPEGYEPWYFRCAIAKIEADLRKRGEA